MRKAIIAAALFLAAGPAFAADATGVWKTPSGGEVEIFHCGGDLCGKLLSSPRIAKEPGLKDANNKDPAQRGRTLKGMVFITGFKGGPSTWSNGKLYNPEDGNTYAGAITLQGDGRLQLKGCAAIVLCKTQVWARIR